MYFMASFAAIGYRLPSGSSARPASYYQTPNYQQMYISSVIRYNKAKAAFNAAKKRYNNQKRSVSGGLRGWVNRRKFGNAGRHARNDRNKQLNTQLKNNLNRAKKAMNNTQNNNYFKVVRWYNTLYNQNKSAAKHALNTERKRQGLR
jgi:hypothetical protein